MRNDRAAIGSRRSKTACTESDGKSTPYHQRSYGLMDAARRNILAK